MGLLDIFLQNQSSLDINPTPQPGSGPIEPATGEFNTGATQFQQTWNSNNTYLNAFEGGVNTGIQPPTLSETGLDIDDPNYIQSTTTPNTLTVYPATAVGGLGQSAVQFLQIWSPVINYNDVVVGAPTSPLAQSLPETGLDNTDTSAVPTTVSPINTTDYPNLATGEYNSVSNQYAQTYGPNNTYLNTYNPNIQPDSLDETGLDVENIGLISTTAAPSTNTQYPSLAVGEFGGQSNNFNQIYTPNNTYLNTLNPQTQPNTVNNGETGLDNTNLLAFNTTFIPNAISSPTNYPQLPQTNLGEFGGTPSQFTPLYNPNPGQRYLDNYNNIISLAGNQQIVNLGNTGLDVENQNSAPTTYTVPYLDNITQYPVLATGEFNGASTLFTQTFTPLLTYNNLVANTPLGPYSILEQSLNQTGLDINDQNAAPTTYAVPTTDDTTYPTNATGEYNGPALPYEQAYSSTPGSTYEDFIVNAVNGPASVVENSLVYTGLDVENQDAASTTYTVPEVDDTVYPYVEGAVLQPKNTSILHNFQQTWKPKQPYYSFMIENFEGQIK